MIRFRQLNRFQLKEYIYSEEFRLSKNIPISRHRALSQINNPRANDDDVLLLVAYEGNQLVGYLGILPDLIYLNNKSERCGWFSCIWVDQNHRGKNIAFLLVQKGMEVWNNKILATEFTGPAKKLYNKTNKFVDLDQKTGIRLYMRWSLHTILPPKKKIFQNLIGLFKAMDYVSNIFLDLRFYFYKSNLPNIRLEYNSLIDDQIDDLVRGKQHHELFRRGKSELNWIIRNPWILSSPKSDKYSEKYHFSSLDRNFEFAPVKVFNKEQKLVAYLIFTRRNNNLKLPYCYYNCDTDLIIKLLKYHLKKWKVSIFTTYHQPLVSALKKADMSSLLKREMKRGYIISTNFKIDLHSENHEIQDGDGDCVFT